MRLSVLLPTHRTSLAACSRIAQICAWASPDIEVIVRDNSGDPKKRELLNLFRRDHCSIIFADPCNQLTSYSETLRQATGDFVFFTADDDSFFDEAISAVPAVIERHVHDPGVVGFTGGYVTESRRGSSIMTYDKVDSDDPVTRVKAYLSAIGPSVLYYSPMRRDVVQRTFDFMNTMPFFFSFQDQLNCLVYVLNGKFVSMQRLLYIYSVGDWENAETAEKRDTALYTRAGFDPAINMLQWFLCGLEGAILVRNADSLFPALPSAQRQMVADLWFSVMFLRFKNEVRQTFGSSFADAANKLRGKLLGTSGRVLFQDQLAEICDFLALFSKDNARAYFVFWDGVLNRRPPESVGSGTPSAGSDPAAGLARKAG